MNEREKINLMKKSLFYALITLDNDDITHSDANIMYELANDPVIQLARDRAGLKNG